MYFLYFSTKMVLPWYFHNHPYPVYHVKWWFSIANHLGKMDDARLRGFIKREEIHRWRSPVASWLWRLVVSKGMKMVCIYGIPMESSIYLWPMVYIYIYLSMVYIYISPSQNVYLWYIYGIYIYIPKTSWGDHGNMAGKSDGSHAKPCPTSKDWHRAM